MDYLIKVLKNDNNYTILQKYAYFLKKYAKHKALNKTRNKRKNESELDYIKKMDLALALSYRNYNDIVRNIELKCLCLGLYYYIDLNSRSYADVYVSDKKLNQNTYKNGVLVII